MASEGRKVGRVCVVVLGDVGHSPRMQYHALSLAREGFQVDLVGYGGSRPHEDLLDNKGIQIHTMRSPPEFRAYMPRLMSYAAKVLWQIMALFFTLILLKRPSHILVQNPPAIPSLAVVWIVSCMRKSAMIIDFHNYGYTILAMSLGATHPLVRFSKWYEGFFGVRATASMCVTQAMKAHLDHQWNITSTVLYDRPAELFHSISVEEKHWLFIKLSKDYSVFSHGDDADCEESDGAATAFTEISSLENVTLRGKRPALIVSSTSWTADEDFSILLTALEDYEATIRSGREDLPNIVCIITGKGPLKEHYTKLISNKVFQHVKFCTPWLSAEDYPKLLACADLGVCLHTSSSGLDLPMKVVDMFGVGLPVCAIQFNCLNELVKHEHNGLVFQNENELSAQLQELLSNFPDSSEKLRRLRENVVAFQAVGWHQSWRLAAYQLFGGS
ncbi:PREDICTED: chitobiosyldiphosphodolichol beta-mannosyltransferase-like [Priapulus caudatus]|uniref:Chitobiosyldiphosphodolichol beta-mannosyltransferase-like n=1 Tax=Priapulus caudatus TaxID=37621 RepID=A0ABM1EGQ1_PRICU|nr:PREDICTED: chitobiosyldiphosphodolichol beta-mannosyltransferase-like [Priapulus caudatus]